MQGKISGILAGIGCALMWIGAAFVVGFPSPVFAGNWSGLAAEFIHGEHKEFVLIPFLLLVDVVIAVILDHFSISRTKFAIISLFSAIYVLAVGIAPGYSDVHGDIVSAEKTHLWLFNISLICLCGIRFLTFQPKRFVRMKLLAHSHGENGITEASAT